MLQKIKIIALTLLVTLPSEVFAGNFVAADFSYFKGDFGSPVTEKLSMFYASLGRIEPNYDLSVSLPYLSFNRSDDTQAVTESGIGDLFLRGGFRLVSEAKAGFSLYGSLSAKIALADETKGLGSGENDYGLSFNLSKQWDKIRGSIYTGYSNNGDPQGLNYANTPLLGISVAKYFGLTSAYVSLQKSKALVDSNKDPFSLLGGVYHMFTTKLMFRGQVSLGLSDGSADYGFNVGLVNWF